MTDYIRHHPIWTTAVWLIIWAALWPIGHLFGSDEVAVWTTFLLALINARIIDAALMRPHLSAWGKFWRLTVGVVGSTAVAYLPTTFALHLLCQTAVATTLESARMCYDSAFATSNLFPILLLTGIFLISISLYLFWNGLTSRRSPSSG